MSAPLRTVLVGFGRIAASEAGNRAKARFYRFASHAQVLAAHPGFELVGAADPDPAARECAAGEWKVPCVAESAAGLAQLAPEVAVLAVPPGARLAALDALPGLRGVLVEKPLALAAPERRAFADACRERGLTVQVNYFRRADVMYRELAAGGLASLVGGVQAVFGLYGRGLFNIGAHFVDLARMLLGEVAWVRALGGESRGETVHPGDPNLPFALGLASGATASFLPVDYAKYREGGLDIWGEKGRLSLLVEGLLGQAFPAGAHRALDDRREVASDRPQALPYTLGEAYYGMYDDLSAALAGERACCCGLDEALATEAVCDAVLASAAAGGSRVDVGGGE